MATLENTSGQTANSLTVAYNLTQGGTANAEQVPGHRVYYSLTGAAGSWAAFNDIDGATGAKSGTAALGAGWPQNTLMYVLWADDNGDGSTDRGYQIDGVTFTPGFAAIPLSCTLTAPPDGQTLAAPATVVASANAVGTVPPTAVTFYTNGVQFATVAAPGPFTATLPNLPPGVYAFQARAVNASETADSATHTITVRDEFMHYLGGTLGETFDVMGTDGMLTPVGWYVGWAPPIQTLTVTVGDGSVGPAGTVAGWNYGLTNDFNRSLGTAPTSTGAPAGDRNTAVRIENNSGANIVSFEFRYDGEVWRNHTNVVEWLTNFVSYDRGATWVATGFDFQSPVTPVEPAAALNGHDSANRVADIGGSLTPPAPIAPYGVIYVRWWNFNDSGTDGALAIDNFRFTATLAPFTPYVGITAPANGATYIIGDPIPISAVAGLANPIAYVEFYRDGNVLIGTDPTPPYSAVYSNATLGSHTLFARAYDTLGNSLLSTNTVTVTVGALPYLKTLIDSNSVWKYLDDGSDQGTAWQALLFPDDSWPSGQAKLGYGDADVVTTLARTNAGGTTNITFYFRQKFYVEDLSLYTNLIVRFRRDDGGVVYINATEVFRSNMPEGTIDYLTPAAANTSSETTFFPTNVNPSVLVLGTNVIAAEVHQETITSSDVGFDLQLQAQSSPDRALRISTDGVFVTVSWDGSARLQYKSDLGDPNWTTLVGQTSPYIYSIAAQPGPLFFRLVP
jgi:hypothetical protein